jgi:hypothetical protein
MDYAALLITYFLSDLFENRSEIAEKASIALLMFLCALRSSLRLTPILTKLYSLRAAALIKHTNSSGIKKLLLSEQQFEETN